MKGEQRAECRCPTDWPREETRFLERHYQGWQGGMHEAIGFDVIQLHMTPCDLYNRVVQRYVPEIGKVPA